MTGAVKSRTAYLGMALLNFGFPNWGDDANKNTSILDAAFSLIGIAVDGAWANSTAYDVGALVVDTDLSQLFRCQVAHTSPSTGTFAAARAAQPTYWAQETNRVSYAGVWTEDVVYHAGEFLSDTSRFGICTETFTAAFSYDSDVSAGHIETLIDASAFSSLPIVLVADNILKVNAAGTAYELIAPNDLLDLIGGVEGPGVSVVGNVPTFGDTGGFVLADSGTALSSLAPKASPTLTGTPLAPTAAPGTNTTQIATTQFVKAAIDVVLGGVSAAYDTLAEIATAIGTLMVKSNNLSDVADAATAFGNIKQAATTSATGVVERATVAEVRSGADSVYPTSKDLVDASDWVTATDGATVTIDHAAGRNQKVTFGGNRTMAAPSNVKVGEPFNLWLVQDGTGNRVPTWNAAFDFGDYGTPTLSTGANQADLLSFMALTTGKLAFMGIRRRVD